MDLPSEGRSWKKEKQAEKEIVKMLYKPDQAKNQERR